tara:strand:+ start:321 stop:1058 length:738 start_codon:yes stop_codon:yes gene_type:complete
MSLKIFIGSSSNNEDSPIECVYEYTLRKNSSRDLDITWMRQTNNINSYWYGWSTSEWFTPFSGFRWGIAESCQFKGKALYTDVDMINFRDISEIFNLKMFNKPFAARLASRFKGFQPCFMLIDCERAKNFLAPKKQIMSDKSAHNKYMSKFLKKPWFWDSRFFAEIDPRWNCLDGESLELAEIFQLHFTNMSTQPWTPEWYKGEISTHPRKDILEVYFELLEEASAHGFKPSKYKKSFDYKIIGC